MATKTVVVSDLTGEVIADDDHVSIVVRDHPALEGPVRLDAGSAEVATLAGAASDFVVIELHTQSGVENLVVELKKFDKLFKGDAQTALEGAERLTEAPARRRGRPRGSAGATTGAKVKRDPATLNKIREWARGNGWPDLSSRGRIPAEAEAAFEASQIS